MFKTHEIQLISDITDVLNKFIAIHQPNNREMLCILGALYVDHVKRTEEVVSLEEDVAEIRDQAIDLIGSLLYEDGLLEDEGTFH